MFVILDRIELSLFLTSRARIQDEIQRKLVFHRLGPQLFFYEYTAISNPVLIHMLNLCTAWLKYFELKDRRPPLVSILLSKAVVFNVLLKKWVHFTLESSSISNDYAQGPTRGIPLVHIDGTRKVEDFNAHAKGLFHETLFGIFKVDWWV